MIRSTYSSTVHRKSEQGFTLVELSIVLVIIGLIVGGVLVGQDLIKAAEIRATVGQIEKYNAAINTFRTRYGGLPGDLSNASATNFGMLTGRTANAGQGDANGLLEGGAAAATDVAWETALFWRDLGFANLVDGAFAGGVAAVTTSATAPVGSFVPPAKVGRGNYITVFSSNGLNFYEVAYMSAIAAGVPTMASAGMTPTETMNMDNKIDDGLPNTGIVLAQWHTTLNNGPQSATPPAAMSGASTVTTACVNTTPTPPVYNTLNNAPLCNARFRFN